MADYADVTGTYPQPVMRPDEVRGLVGHASVQPDRFFYLLDTDDQIYEVDGYQKTDPETDQPYWELLIMCPRCRNTLRLDSRKKPIEISDRGLETGEPIRCTYPVEADGYKGRCPWGAEFQPPPTKDKLIIPMTDARSGQPGMCKIDALIRNVK